MALPKLQTFITRERFVKNAAVIFLHGEEGCARSLRDSIKSLYFKNWDFEHAEVVYPQATPISYTVENGAMKSVWFDRKTYSPTGPEQTESLERSCSLIRQLVNDIVTSGVNRNRVVLGGVDMGAQLAMHVGYRWVMMSLMMISDDVVIIRHSRVATGLGSHWIVGRLLGCV